MIERVILFAALIACGAGFRYYRWWDCRNPDSSWSAHLLQWWWSYLGIVCVYCFRFVSFDSMFSALGDIMGIFGAVVIGYVVMNGFFAES